MSAAENSGMATTTVRLRDGQVTMPCEVVDDQWAITPALCRHDVICFSGKFTITHRVVGMTVGVTACLDCTRVAAVELAATGWTPDGSHEPKSKPTPKVLAALLPMRECLAEGCNDLGMS